MSTTQGRRTGSTASLHQRKRHILQTSSSNKKTLKKTAEVQPTTAPKSPPRHPGLPRPRKPLPSLPGGEEIPEPISQLRDYAGLLHQLHVRHKNQHRAQIWFKQLGLLRRAVRELLDIEVQLLDVLRGGTGERIANAEDARRHFEREADLKRKKAGLQDWIRDSLLSECYERFSALVADGDGAFANLGLVLLGLVAGVAGLVGLPGVVGDGQVEERVDTRVRRGTERQGDEVNERADGVDADGEDFGMIVHRDPGPDRSNEADMPSLLRRGKRGLSEEHDGEPQREEKTMKYRLKTPTDIQVSAPARARAVHGSASSINRTKKSKKKQKQKNAIDDLFSSFT